MYALTSIKGIGRRFANIVLRKAEVDLKKRYFFDCERELPFEFSASEDSLLCICL